MSTKFQLEGIDYSSVKGKSVLIVGGARTLGLASGLSLAQAGARVTIADVIPHGDVVKAFKSRSLAVQYVKCDVTSWSQQLMAFKQAIQFAPSRTLDIVCSFLQVDLEQDLVDEVTICEPRIDVEPLEPVMDEVDMNIRAVCHLTKLAMHFFGVPDRATALKRARSRSGSIATSITASSVRSRSHSRSGSRPRSGSASGPTSPVQASPPQDAGEPVVITAEPEQKDDDVVEDSTQEKSAEKPLEFTKSLVIVGGMAAYVDYAHSNFLAASAFALRGLFRSLRAKSVKELGVRVNLVSPWAVRSPLIEPRLKELEEEGLIERELADVKPDSPTVNGKSADATIDPASTAIDETTNDTTADTGSTADVGAADSQPVPNESVETGANQEETVTEPSNGTVVATGDEHKAEAISPSEDSAAQEQTKTSELEDDSKEAAEPQRADIVDTDATKEDGSASNGEPEQLVKYKDMHFASIEDIVSTVSRLCADSSVSGRSIAVMPEGAFDLNDDFEGGYAGEEVMKLLNMRKEAGDVIYKLLNLVPETTASS